MSGYAKWKEAFGGQPVCVAHHADARGMDLLLDGSGPWKVRYIPGFSKKAVQEDSRAYHSKKMRIKTMPVSQLGGGFKHFVIFTPGEDSHFDFCIFFRWVGSTNQTMNETVSVGWKL